MKKWECTVCGYIHEGEEPPDECPVCSADKSMFVEVIEQGQHSPWTGRSTTGAISGQAHFLDHRVHLSL